MTDAAKQIMEIETDYTPSDVETLATWSYSQKEFSAPIASGSYRTAGMVIAPCSMKTLGAVANGVSDTLLTRAADVCLKEERKLILMTRETPLNLIHLENMVRAKKAGASILPACPGFYSRPKTLEDLVDIMVGRALDLLGIENDIYERWSEENKLGKKPGSEKNGLSRISICRGRMTGSCSNESYLKDNLL